MLRRQGIIFQSLVALVIGIGRGPVLKEQLGSRNPGRAPQVLLLVSIVVVDTFSIAYYHGVLEALQKAVHNHFSHRLFDLHRKYGVLVDTLQLGLLEHGLFVNPAFQESEAFPVRPGFPLRGLLLDIRKVEFRVPHRNYHGVVLFAHQIACRYGEQHQGAKNA